MQENKILYSDSSYSQETKTASISVYDLINNSYHSQVYTGVSNIIVAETMALKYSISLALTKNYDNVVFIYDNLNIDVESLKQEYRQFFKMIQFVWLKREFLTKVDDCAKKVLKDCFTPTISKRNYKEHTNIKNEEIIDEITKYRKLPIDELVLYFKENFLTTIEIDLVFKWRNKIKDKNLISDKKPDFTNLRILYSLIEKEQIRNEFYNSIKFYYPFIGKVAKFKRVLTDTEIEGLLFKKRKYTR